MNRNLESFRGYVHPHWSGRDMTYLELGVFEGMSLTWMFQRVLTSEGSRAVGVDPWMETTKLSGDAMDQVMIRARKNLSRYCLQGTLGTAGIKRCQLIRGNSAEVLRRMVVGKGYAGFGRDSVDVSMIDGNHNALAVLDDARLVLQLIRIGGWLLFDDVENDHPKRDHVKEGVEMFLRETGDRVKLIWKHRYMEAYERVR